MTRRIDSWILVATFAVAGCGQGGPPAKQEVVSGQNTAAAAAPAPNAPAPPAASAPAAAPVETLTAKGIAPGLDFDMAQAPAVAAAVKAFGAPTGREHNNECGQGPMDFVNFHDLSLEFDGGKFVGWSLGGAKPALHTAGGLAVGAPRKALGGAQVDEQGTLGPEFEVNGVGGILDEKGARIAALWAGSVCQFR